MGTVTYTNKRIRTIISLIVISIVVTAVVLFLVYKEEILAAVDIALAFLTAHPYLTPFIIISSFTIFLISCFPVLYFTIALGFGFSHLFKYKILAIFYAGAVSIMGNISGAMACFILGRYIFK